MLTNVTEYEAQFPRGIQDPSAGKAIGCAIPGPEESSQPEDLATPLRTSFRNSILCVSSSVATLLHSNYP